MTWLYIILIIVVIFGSIGIYHMNIYNVLQNHLLKINEAEGTIDTSLRQKYDLMMTIIMIIKKTVNLDDNYFTSLEKTDQKKISNFDFERELKKEYYSLQQIIADYPIIENNTEVKQHIIKIKKLDEKIDAGIIFYNRYTTALNKIVKSFPANIFAKLHHISCKRFFDNKDMSDEDINDFKL